MKKPDRVEAGQWWTIAGDAPWRIDGTGDGWEWLIDPAHPGYTGLHVYIGSGENPEPSEWMIETLAEHVNAIVDRAAEPTGHARTLARHIVGGGHTRWIDIREGALLERSVLSLYSILRSLGKW